MGAIFAMVAVMMILDKEKTAARIASYLAIFLIVVGAVTEIFFTTNSIMAAISMMVMIVATLCIIGMALIAGFGGR